jgi:hypothetical protein
MRKVLVEVNVATRYLDDDHRVVLTAVTAVAGSGQAFIRNVEATGIRVVNGLLDGGKRRAAACRNRRGLAFVGAQRIDSRLLSARSSYTLLRKDER